MSNKLKKGVFMREFFGLSLDENGEYVFLREAEGAWSWQHLTFVSLILLAMVGLAIFFGMRNKNKDEIQKNKVLIVSAILIDSFEIIKIIVLCIMAALHTTEKPITIFG